MRFWEAFKLATGLQESGNAPSHLVLDKVGIGGPIKIDWKAVPELVNDHVRVAHILSDLFMERRIFYVPFDKELVNWAAESISEVHAELDKCAREFRGSRSESDILLAELLLQWKRATKKATQEIEEAVQTEEMLSKSQLMDWDDMITAQDQLPRILGELRKASYPAISALIDLLPETSIVKPEAVARLTDARRLLYKTFSGADPIEEPDWSFEFEAA